MNFEVKTLLREKLWTILFVCFIVFFNIFFYSLADNLNYSDILLAIIVNIFVAFALISISLFLKNKTEKIYLIILFLLSLVPNIIVFAYIFISGTQMHNDMFWVIIGSNSSESTEYIGQFITWHIYVGVAVYLILGITLLYKSGANICLSKKKHKALFILPFIILATVTMQQDLTNLVSMIDFYKSDINYYWESHQIKKEAMLRKGKIDVYCALPDSTKHTFIVVIGESLSKHHMGIYGYHRQTTPNLDTIKNLYIYNDVVSPNTHTIAVLKHVLTFADYDHPAYFTEKPSIIELFNEAGFETYWISNQEFLSEWGGSYGVIAQEAKHVYNLHILKKHDDVVLPILDEVLADSVKTKNKIIFIHLMGNHHAYHFRYPNEFEHFNNKKDSIPERTYLTPENKKIIDEYDNSVLFADYVVNSILYRLEKKKESSFLIFFSDHAEEIYDFRDLGGHSIANPSRYQCEIPFIVWQSEQYKSETKHQGFVFDVNRSYSTEHFIHSISDLSFLKYKDLNSKFSLFSKDFIPSTRMVGDKTYEEIKLETMQLESKGKK